MDLFHTDQEAINYIAGCAIAAIIEMIGIHTMPCHSEPRGCPFDYCSDIRDVSYSLKSVAFCEQCIRRLYNAFSSGKLTRHQFADLLRITDVISNRRVIFVIMPIKNEPAGIEYDSILKPLIEEAGATPIRVDSLGAPHSWLDDIWILIRRCQAALVVLADGNKNVYYELGVCHGSDKSAIIIKHPSEAIPSDLKIIRHIDMASTTKDWKAALIDEIKSHAI